MVLVLALSLLAGQTVDQRAGLDGGADAADSCVVARNRVSQLEQQIERARVAAEQARERERLECQQMLNLHGEGAFARCMASRAEPVSPINGAQTELEGAREALRRAQVGGCR